MVDESHPEIAEVLKRYMATAPIRTSEAFERELVHMAYQRMRWQMLTGGMFPDLVIILEDYVDNGIRAEARRLREQQAAGEA